MNLTTILKVNGKRELLENSLGRAKFLGRARNGQREAELDLEADRIRVKSDSIRKNRLCLDTAAMPNLCSTQQDFVEFLKKNFIFSFFCMKNIVR